MTWNIVSLWSDSIVMTFRNATSDLVAMIKLRHWEMISTTFFFFKQMSSMQDLLDYQADSEAKWLAIFIMKQYWNQIKQLLHGGFIWPLQSLCMYWHIPAKPALSQLLSRCLFRWAHPGAELHSSWVHPSPASPSSLRTSQLPFSRAEQLTVDPLWSMSRCGMFDAR